jgi:hypothetical protein
MILSVIGKHLKRGSYNPVPVEVEIEKSYVIGYITCLIPRDLIIASMAFS